MARNDGRESVTPAFSEPEPETEIWFAVPVIVAIKLPVVCVASVIKSFNDVAPVPPEVTASAVASVKTPVDENDDVAVAPKYAVCAEKRVDEAVP